LIRTGIEAVRRDVQKAEDAVADQFAYISDLRQKGHDATMAEYFLGAHQRALKAAKARLDSLVTDIPTPSDTQLGH
jgi:hypothetical protein